MDIMLKKFVGSRNKVYGARMDLEESCDRDCRNWLQYVCRIYGVGLLLMKAVKDPYRENRECVKISEGKSECL